MPQMPGQEQRGQQKFLVFAELAKMDTASARTGLPDQVVAWWENLQPLATNKLKVVPAPSPSVLPSPLPENVTLAFYANINGQDFAILFTAAGAGFFINFSTSPVSSGQFAPDGTFSPAPDCTVWQGSRLLINDVVSGYSTWDGVNLFVQAGGLSPNLQVTNGGSGYSVAPPVHVFLVPAGSATGTTPTAGLSVVQIVRPGLFSAPTGSNVALTVAAAPAGGTTASASMSTGQVGTSPFSTAVGTNVIAAGSGYTQTQATAGLVTAPSNITFPTCTISNANPAVVTLANHQLTAGQPITFRSTGTLPTGITAGNLYFVLAAGLTANTFRFSATDGGTPVATTSAGSGTQSVGLAPLFQGILGANGSYVTSTIDQNGSVNGLQLADPGTGFQAGDTVSLFIQSTSGTGGAVTFPGMTGAGIKSLSNTGGFAPGSNFTAGGGPINGRYALTVGASPTGNNASCSFFTVSVSGGNDAPGGCGVVDAAGGGYTSAPAVAVPNGGSGFQTIPAFTANMNPQSVNTGALTVSNAGSGYTPGARIPLVISGGSGSPQAKGIAVIGANGTILSASITAGGSYPLGSQPTIKLPTSGGATGTVHQWPFLPAGSTIAVFQGRVWLGGPTNLLQWSGTGGATTPSTPVQYPFFGGVAYDDFSQADAAGSLQIVDADLVHQISCLRSLNNYLWIIGDQSVKQIGNISVTAGSSTSPSITVFQLVTLSSDQGTIWPKSCISFNRIVMFANPNGVFGIFGSTVQKISDDLDGIFQALDPSVQPQGAILDLNSRHNAVFLLRYVDPIAGTRSLLCLFDGKKWWLGNQGPGLGALMTYPQLSSDINTLWGTITGLDFRQLFADPATAQPFKLSTSLSAGGNPVQGKKAVRAGFTADASSSANVTVTMESESAALQRALAVTPATLLVGGANDANDQPVNAAGIYIGATLTGTFAGFILQNVIIEYQETSLWKGT